MRRRSVDRRRGGRPRAGREPIRMRRSSVRPDFADAIDAPESARPVAVPPRAPVRSQPPTPAVTGPRWRGRSVHLPRGSGPVLGHPLPRRRPRGRRLAGSGSSRRAAGPAPGHLRGAARHGRLRGLVPFFVTDPRASTAPTRCCCCRPSPTSPTRTSTRSSPTRPATRPSPAATRPTRRWAGATGSRSTGDGQPLRRAPRRLDRLLRLVEPAAAQHAPRLRVAAAGRPARAWPGPAADRLGSIAVAFGSTCSPTTTSTRSGRRRSSRTGGDHRGPSRVLDRRRCSTPSTPSSPAAGRVAYLGGNGLLRRHRDRPSAATHRRGRRPLFGSRPSSSEPGETWMTTHQEEGGTWRARGRPPHARVGVGTTSMGAGPGRGFRRTEASYEPAYSWVFDGVDGELIGRGWHPRRGGRLRVRSRRSGSSERPSTRRSWPRRAASSGSTTRCSRTSSARAPRSPTRVAPGPRRHGDDDRRERRRRLLGRDSPRGAGASARRRSRRTWRGSRRTSCGGSPRPRPARIRCAARGRRRDRAAGRRHRRDVLRLRPASTRRRASCAARRCPRRRAIPRARFGRGWSSWASRAMPRRSPSERRSRPTPCSSGAGRRSSTSATAASPTSRSSAGSTRSASTTCTGASRSPLVRRRDCVGVGGRVDHHGDEIEPLAEADLGELADALAAPRATDEGDRGRRLPALLLSAPEHERRVREAVERAPARRRRSRSPTRSRPCGASTSARARRSPTRS